MKSFFSIVGLICFIFMWYVGSYFIGQSLIPAPHKVADTAISLLLSGKIFLDLGYTIYRSIAAFALAFLIGLVIAVISGTNKKVEQFFYIPLVIIQGAPPILWIVPIVIVFGIGVNAVIAVTFLVVLPLVILTVTEGVKSIDRRYFELFRLYSLPYKNVFKQLIVPSLYPYFRTVIILGFVLAMKSTIIAEWFGAKDGIGKVINMYFYTFQMTTFYAVALIFIFMVLFFGYLVTALTSIFLKRHKTLYNDQTAKKLNFRLESHPGSIFCSDMSFSYGKKLIVSNLNFSLDPGNVAVLSGPSGCGKTTLLRLLSGSLKPFSGDIKYASKTAVLFQDDLLLEHLDLLGNVLLPIIGNYDEDIKQKALYALKLCGIEEFASYYPDEISGGMKKRAAFARTLMFDPAVIILDEPFNNIDKKGRLELWELFFSLFVERKIPALIITHYPEEITYSHAIFYGFENHSLKEL